MSGEKHHNFGKTGSDHHSFGKKKTPEHVAKTSGESNGMFGKTGADHPSFGTTWSRSPGQVAKISGQNNGMFGKSGALSPTSKPVVVFGKAYPAASTASDALRAEHAPNRTDNFIKGWSRIKKHQPYTFYVTKEFYVHALLFEMTDITRDFYEKWSKT
jgi:hypothetical protein